MPTAATFFGDRLDRISPIMLGMNADKRMDVPTLAVMGYDATTGRVDQNGGPMMI